MRKYYLLFGSAIFVFAAWLTSYSVFSRLSSGTLVFLALFALISSALSIRKNALFNLCVIFLVFLAGITRYNEYNRISGDNIKNLIGYPGEKIFLEGIVSGDVSEGRNKITFPVAARGAGPESNFKNASGFALVNLYGKRERKPEYGDIVVLEGYLAKPFSYKRGKTRDYADYLANKRIYSALSVRKDFYYAITGESSAFSFKIKKSVYKMRSFLGSRIDRYANPPANALLQAMLLGKRENIPAWIRDIFGKTGAMHILAISGLHVGIIYFALRILFKICRIARNPSALLSILFMVFFSVLAGARPSVLRAGAMFSILAAGELLKRRLSVYNLIGLSCMILTAVNPNQIFDLGFAFSYLTVLSIVYISPALYPAFYKNKPSISSYFLKSVTISAAAWLGIMPLLAYYFGIVSPVIVIANLIAIPLAFFAMGSGLLLITLGLFSNFLSATFAASASFSISLLIAILGLMKDMPFSYFCVKKAPDFITIFAYYAVLFTVTALIKKRKRSEKNN